MKNPKEKEHTNEDAVIRNEGMCEIKVLIYGTCLNNYKTESVMWWFWKKCKNGWQQGFS